MYSEEIASPNDSYHGQRTAHGVPVPEVRAPVPVRLFTSTLAPVRNLLAFGAAENIHCNGALYNYWLIDWLDVKCVNATSRDVGEMFAWNKDKELLHDDSSIQWIYL